MSNPFLAPEERTNVWGHAASTERPVSGAFVQPERPTNAYNNAGSNERELQERERILAAREKAVTERERKAEEAGFKPPNWPKFRPIVYHDIEKDMPTPAAKALMKQAFSLWHIGAASYVMNFIAAFSLLVTKADGASQTFGLSLMIMLIGIPVSFNFWYMALYNGVKRDRSINFFLFFVNFGFHLAAAILLSIGISGWGGAGLIYALAQFSNNIGSAVLCVIAFVVFAVEILYGLWFLKNASFYYRNQGMTLAKAQEEGIQAAARSKVGQDFAMAGVKAAATNSTR
ncbi:hypothetical protein SmJEL517_g00779 [Synchytrium microbalum]|uniref:Secretory carrier membrane protein n=1 Tax=Synchytrium microbalum TaxID=1806994 RepID=A0A507CHQ8_9FUNG|nr:uncharacterized protein SmJEL517_g00779 [Synchytrium microbalum]TPX37646.1 hypothetical protein SmJEL517_g00779 [Synchytrium microbalum]